MQTPNTVTLRELGDSDLTVADRDIDIRGRKVLDRSGDEIGTIDDLLIDDRERKVRFLKVTAGGLLGIGAETLLVPVDAITRVGDDAVHIDQLRERAAGAPRYQPDLVRERSFWDDQYAYWGYPPYWAPGYVYPPYPHYAV